MPVTVIGSTAVAQPEVFQPRSIWIKKNWSDEWQLRNDLQLVNWSFAVSEAGISQAEFFSRYNDQLMLPGETTFTDHPPLDLNDYWVRIGFVADSKTRIEFQGRIYNDVRDMASNEERRMGMQPWVAYGPKKILQLIDFHNSFWLDADEEKEIQWSPDMNLRDKRKLLVGNRSATRGGTNKQGSYLFGGKDVWTNLQFVEYILEHFVEQDSGPAWSITGQSDVLDGLKNNLALGEVSNVEEVLRKLISRDYGLDFRFDYTDEGFELFVFTQLANDSTFSGSTMPANPNIVQVIRGTQIKMISVTVVRSNDNKVDRFRLVGKRVVMCATLGGKYADIEVGVNELEKKWTDALEVEYDAGTGDSSDDSKEHEKARKNDKFKSVYQQFGAPVDYDYRKGELSPVVGFDGEVDDTGAPYQNSVRNTLTWLPLKEGYEYDVYPPENNNLPDVEPELRAPIAYIYDEDVESFPQEPRYVECHQNGMSVSVPHNDLGIFLNASPNYLLALNHAFEDPKDFTIESEPIYDFDTLVVTIAWESDQRLQFGYDVPDNLKKGDGSVKVISVPDAEMWLLAPKTVVGLKVDGTFQYSTDGLVELRNDNDRLALLCAGEIARYINTRIRAKIEMKGLQDWSAYLGQILQAIEEAGESNSVGAPITTITWTNGTSPSTSVSTGYA